MWLKLAVQLSGKSLTFSLMLPGCLSSLLLWLKRDSVFWILPLWFRYRRILSLLMGKSREEKENGSPSTWLEALRFESFKRGITESSAGGRLKLLRESCEQAGSKLALVLEPTVVSVWCHHWGAGPDWPSVHLREPAGPERRRAAVQTCSVSAAEESLVPVETAWRTCCMEQLLLSYCVRLLLQPFVQLSCLTLSHADA